MLVSLGQRGLPTEDGAQVGAGGGVDGGKDTLDCVRLGGQRAGAVGWGVAWA